MWVLLVLLGIVLAFVQIQERLNYFLQYPTTSTAIVNSNKEIRFPQVTFCNENQMKKSVAKKAGEKLRAENSVVYRIHAELHFKNFEVWNFRFENTNNDGLSTR